MPAPHISTDGCKAFSAILTFPTQRNFFSLKPKIFRCSEKFPEPGIFENLEISRFCEKASFCNPLLHFEVAESDSELQICVWIAYFIEKSIFRKMLHMARNFQTWLQDYVAARKDFELKIRLLSAVSIGFRGLEAQLQLIMKSVRK